MRITIILETKPDVPENMAEIVERLLRDTHPWLPGWVFEHVELREVTYADN